ncbi:MAG: RsmF rRNA methyltransferase first C-terminal domain-containing protein [Clostridia bacterium]|nr:RsmF rRNA methyltransferase first C-terminal domain-containing protein [Clostridia bacterium]
MIELPQRFKERMRPLMGDKYEDFLASYDRSPYKAIRVNTLKISTEEFKKISPFELRPVSWEKNGFYVTEEKAGKSVLHAAGLYYVQEPSAMCAVPLLNVKRGERVLDLCSAPGGKGTQIAQQMEGDGVLVLNDVNFSRAKILSQNVERLGVTNAVIISESPQRISEHFEGYFDKVLVDAPCSGDGMFLKEESALGEWSEENVKTCAKRQALILECAQRALRPNGLLVYSTCTFAPEEDEGQIENFLKKYPHFKLLSMHKLYPHECEGEGHFAALLQKTDGEEGNVPLFKAKVVDKKILSEWQEFEMYNPCGLRRYGNFHQVGDILYSLPNDCPELPFKTLRAGLRLAEIKCGRIEPCHALAMSLKDLTLSFSLNEESAIEYLKGYQIGYEDADSLMIYGWIPVTYLGHTLGWGKLVEGALKNHLPKGLRI